MTTKKYIVFDICGTLADVTEILPLWNSDRDEFFARLGDAKIIQAVADIFYKVSKIAEPVIYTVRPEKTRTITRSWLIERYIDTETLLMRADNDNRDDVTVKLEMLEKAGLTPDNVLFIVEDRTCVVKALREKGFTVLQCADNDY